MATTIRLAAAIVMMFAAPDMAFGQVLSRSLSELQGRLAPGERIQVVDDHRSRLEGEFDGVSGTSLRISVNGRPQVVPEAQIFQVRAVGYEPDGILLGLGAGFAAGLSYVFIACGGASEHSDCLRAGSLVIGGPAAAVGALIDWKITTFVPIFERRRTSAQRWHVAPLLAGPRRGVLLGVTF